MYNLKDFGIEKSSGVLDNGSKIFHFHKPNAPISSFAIFDAGSRHDPIGKEGTAHYTEHMLFKSTKKFKDETETGLFLESIGGSANAFTGVDFLGITAEIGMREDLYKIVDFVHELSRNSLFEESKVNTERGTIFGEIADYESNPALYIQDLTQQVLFQETYAARSIAGTKETVEKISRDDLFEFYSSRILKNTMNIVTAGDADFNEIVGLFNNAFGHEKLSEPHFTQENLNLPRGNPVKIKLYKDTDQVFMGFSFRTCPYKNIDSTPLEVIRTIMGSGFSSSLYRKLRTENGLVYSLDVSSEGSFDRGCFSVITSTSKDKVQKVLHILIDEFRRLREGKIFQEELELAKNKIIKEKFRKMQSSESWVAFHVPEIIFNSENPLDLSDWLNEIEKVKLEDVILVSEKYFNSENWYLSLCGDVKESDFSFIKDSF